MMTRTTFTTVSLLIGCCMAAGLGACDDGQDEHGLFTPDDDDSDDVSLRVCNPSCPNGYTCVNDACVFYMNTAYDGIGLFTNLSETAEETVDEPQGGEVTLNLNGGDSERGNFSGTTWSGTDITEIRVDESTGQIEVKVGGTWGSPVASGAKTKLRITTDIGRGPLTYDLFITTEANYSVSVNGSNHTVYTYTVSVSQTPSTSTGWNLCTDNGTSVALPNVHVQRDVSTNHRAELVSKSGSTYFALACTNGAVGKPRAAYGVHPNSTPNYTRDRYQAFIWAYLGMLDSYGTTSNYGDYVYFKDLYNNPAWFGGSYSEGGTYQVCNENYWGTCTTWEGILLESIYKQSTDGADCYKTYSSSFFSNVTSKPYGVHRNALSDPPGTQITGWSSQSTTCNQSAGAGGVAAYVYRAFENGTNCDCAA